MYRTGMNLKPVMAIVCICCVLALSPVEAGLPEEEASFTHYSNRYSQDLQPEYVASQGADLELRVKKLDLWPGQVAVVKQGAVEFQCLALRHISMDYSQAVSNLRGLDRYSVSHRVNNGPDDLLIMYDMEGDSARNSLELYLYLGGLVDEHATIPLQVGYGPDSGTSIGTASFRYRGDKGFVREIEFDTRLQQDPAQGGTLVFFELRVRTDWRGFFVSRRLFKNEVVQKLLMLVLSMTG